jgi:O-antigen/teichoic acid export membrane protein
MTEEYEQDWLLKGFSRKWCRTIFVVTVALYILSIAGSICFAYLTSMSFVAIVGAFWLGALIGMSFGFYVQEELKWNRQALIASLQLIAGASIIGLFHLLSQHSSYGQEYWFYPIGLVGGFIIGTLWHHADPPKQTTDS